MGNGKMVDRVSSSKSREGWSLSGEEKRGQKREEQEIKFLKNIFARRTGVRRACKHNDFHCDCVSNTFLGEV